MIFKYLKNISTYYLLFSILVFLIFIYKISVNNESINYNLKYAIIAFVMIMLSFISFLNKKNQNVYINIILISAVLALYTFEFYLSYEKIVSNKISKITVIEEHKKKINNNVVTVIPPKKHLNNSKFFPLAGISNTETVYCNELGFIQFIKVTGMVLII